MERPGQIDIAIIALYALMLCGLALHAARRRGGTGEYFLASRGASWPVVGLSLLASNISSTTLIGLSGAAYLTGISVFNYEWMAAVVLVAFTAIMLPSLLASGVYTMPEFLERRYDRSLRLYFAALTLFLNIVVDAAGTLYAGAFLFRLIYPDVALWIIVAGLAAAAGAYTIVGGMRAVLHTEVLQAIILLGGSAVIAILTFTRAGGWDAVMAAVPASHLSLIRPLGDPAVPWLGLVTGVPILGFYFWCTNQFMVQRVLAARSLDHGRWGSLFAGLLKLPVLYLMVLPGVAALLIFRDLPSADLVYPRLLFGLVPHGLMGLVIAGFLAAAMSSLAATFNSAATLFTMDFVAPVTPGAGDARLTRIGRISTFVFMLLAAAWAPQIAHFASLWQYLQTILAFAAPPIVAIFLCGLLWRPANRAGARAAVLAGLAAGIGLFVAGPVSGALPIHFLFVAPILLSIATIALVAASLCWPSAAGVAPEAVMWTPAVWRAETVALSAIPWWRNYRIQGLALLLLTAAIVIAFR